MPGPPDRADVIVVGAGRSTRMGGTDKLAAEIGGRPLLAWTLAALDAAPESPGSWSSLAPSDGPRSRPPAGCRRASSRSSRAASAARSRSTPGSRRLDRHEPDPTGVVLVHDAARPLVEPALIAAVAAATARHGAAIPVVPVAETLKRIDGERVGATVDRTGLGAAQTPQGVRRDLLREAWRRYPPDGPSTFTDEAALLEACSIPVHVVPGDPGNLKVTLPSDLAASGLGCWPGPAGRGRASATTATRSGPGCRSTSAASRSRAPRRWPATPTATSSSTPWPTRCSGRPRWATSDGSSRPTTGRRAASRARVLVEEVRRRVEAAGWRPASVDLTVIAARPRLGAHLGPMRDAIAALARAGSRRRSASRPRAAISTGPRAPAAVDLRARRSPRSRRSDDASACTTRCRARPARSSRCAPDRVGVYSCGPTVYGPAHIGNFRSFLFADLLVRHLRWRGYPVTWVMNITDIDDKIIRGAAATGEPIDVARRALPGGLPERCRSRPDDAAPTCCRGRPSTSSRSPRSSRRSSSAGTPTGPTTARSSSGSRRGPPTAGWPASTPRRCGWGSGSRPTNTARTTSATSPCGRAPSPASRRGRRRSGPAGPAGTSNARR